MNLLHPVVQSTCFFSTPQSQLARSRWAENPPAGFGRVRESESGSIKSQLPIRAVTKKGSPRPSTHHHITPISIGRTAAPGSCPRIPSATTCRLQRRKRRRTALVRPCRRSAARARVPISGSLAAPGFLRPHPLGTIDGLRSAVW